MILDEEFLDAFFGPGNRLRWPAIQARSLSRDVQDRLGPFLDDLQRNPDVLVLPRVLDTGRVQWYVLCASPRAARIARDEARAFLGPTYSDFEGRPTQLDPADPLEAAVLARCGNSAFRLDVSERALFATARERLLLWMRLRHERPARHARRLRPVGRVLRDFEYALVAADGYRAGELIDELRSAGHLSATNLLFLDVLRLACAAHWDAVLALPGLDSLLQIPRPRRVTEALINAVYTSRLQEFEEGARAEEAAALFRSEIFPRFRPLYRSRATLSGFPADASFLMAAGASTAARRDVAATILCAYPPDSPQRTYLTALGALIPAWLPEVDADALGRTRTAFAEGDADRAYELARALPPSLERTALLLRCAHELGLLSAARVALSSVRVLSSADRSRLDRDVILRRCRDSLERLSSADLPTPTAPTPTVELPSTWSSWLRRLKSAQPWPAAVTVAETAAREWSTDTFAGDASAVQEVAALLLDTRPEWGEEALRDSLPHLLAFFLAARADLRLKPIYENLFLLIAVDDHVSLPQAGALLTVVDRLLQLGVTPADYREMIARLSQALDAIESPAVVPLALAALEVLINAPCPAPSHRQNFFHDVARVFDRWPRRVDEGQFALLRQLGAELGVAHAIADEAPRAAPRQQSPWSALGGKRVAMYSLQESALRRAASVVAELCPRARVHTFSDRDGGSPALRTAAATADVFVLAPGAATHAATNFIEKHRRLRPTLYARGQGSASLVAAIRESLPATPN